MKNSNLEEGVDQLLHQEGYAYTLLWGSLPLNQRRLLRALAVEVNPAATLASAFLSKYALGSASSVQRAAAGLEECDVIEREANRYFIGERPLGIWLRRQESALGLAR